ncbi:MAG: chemotaxis protein CheW [Elusimicrobiota bacterium]
MRPEVFDWTAIHQRLRLFQQAVQSTGELDPDQKKKILRERARALAHVPETETADQKRLEVLKFQLAAEVYGVELRFVVEAYPMKRFTPVPCTPPHIFGVVNVRGRLLTVIDIKKLFGLPEAGLTDLNKIVVLRQDEVEFGLLADVVLGTGIILERDIQPSLPTFTGVQLEYFRGVTKESLIILAGEKLLTSTALAVHEDVER